MVPSRSFDRWLLSVALAGPTLFLIVVSSLHIVQPEYDPRARFLSEYAVGSYGTLMNIAILAIGAGAMALGLVLARQQAASRFHSVTSIALVLSGAEACLLALLPADVLPNTVDARITSFGTAHSDIAIAQLVTGLLAALSWPWAVIRARLSRTMRHTASISGFGVCVAFLLLFLLRTEEIGLGQRIWVSSNAVWVLTFGALLQYQRRKTGALLPAG